MFAREFLFKMANKQLLDTWLKLESGYDPSDMYDEYTSLETWATMVLSEVERRHLDWKKERNRRAFSRFEERLERIQETIQNIPWWEYNYNHELSLIAET